MKFDIVGGSFGTDGSLIVDGQLKIVGAKQADYSFSDVSDIIVAGGEKVKKTSILSVIVGVIITIFLTVFFNIIGFAIGLLLTIVGSKYTEKGNPNAEIKFNDGKMLNIKGQQNRINELIGFIP